MYGSLGFKGIVSNYGSTALVVTYIGFGIKIPTNLGLLPDCIESGSLGLKNVQHLEILH